MKRLIFRLSSLGDVVLSQALLEAPYQGETHWVVAKEYESLLVGNPKIARVWVYDRKTNRGIRPWLELLNQLVSENFTHIIDAHSTLRTKIASAYFFWKFLFSGKKPHWSVISKQRMRRFTYATFKRLTPETLRPSHLSYRCAQLVGGSGAERPNLEWMLKSPSKISLIGIAPASAWKGKEWITSGYLELIKDLQASTPIVEFALFGTSNDRAVNELAISLKKQGIPFQDFFSVKRPLNEVAQTLATTLLVIGADTGLLHLAEAVGVPVVTIYGPTRSDFGFGPLHPNSRPVETKLWCSPCSKDGSLCFRTSHRFQCLADVKSSQVLNEVKRVLISRGQKL